MNPTILLVDLASAERENWKAFLEDQKYDVLTADNAESARRLCLELQPDLVLLHDHLPQVRGFELCRRLKEDPVNHLTPVVLVSAAPTPRELEQGREAGAADFWGTPSSLGDWLGRIESLMKLKNLIDEKRSEEHTSELQSRLHLVCRLLLEKKNNNKAVLYLLQALCLQPARHRHIRAHAKGLILSR